jgi:pimeloyl-ACP methyl ester carboxylesterase
VTATQTSSTSANGGGDSADAAIERFVTLQARLLEHYGVIARSTFVALPDLGIRTHVLEAGEGEPVVIFHGGDGEAVNWAPLMAHLQGHAHLYAVDRPGFGLTDRFDYSAVDLRTHAADFVDALLDALGLESATLVGGSMGGFFVLATAIARPERVRNLVLAGYAAGTTTEIGPALQAICADPAAAAAFMEGRDTLEAQRSQYREMFHIDPDTVPELYFETRIAGLRLPSEKGTWATLLTRIGSADGLRPEVYLGDELDKISAPTLVIWGEHDMAPADLGRWVAQSIPAGHFAYLPTVGHFPYLEAPEATARLIVDFMNTQRAG